MEDARKTKKQLIRELDDLRQRVAGLEAVKTEQLTAEEALEESEKRYRALVDNALVGVYATNVEGDILYVNEALARIFEFDSPEEMMARGVLERYKDAKKRQSLIKTLLEEGAVSDFEIEILTKTGRTKTVLLSAILDGDVITGMIMDITYRKRAEEALRQSEEKYRLVVENANEAILIAQDAVLKFVNPKTTDLIGYSEDELTSLPFIEFIYPEDRQMVVERHLRRLQGENFLHVYPFRVVRKDGTVRWAEINAVLIDWQGRPATLNFLSDITDRKEAEEALRESQERYHTLFNNAADLIAVIDTEGNFLDLNERFEEESGYSREEMIGKNAFASGILTESSAARAVSFLNNLLAGKTYPIFEVEGIRKDGGIIPYELKAVPIKKDGNIFAIQAILRDITDRKRAEEALRHSKELFEKTFSSQRDAIFILDARIPPTILDCNPAATEIFGYDRREMLGRTSAFLHVDGTRLRELQEDVYPAVEERGFLHQLEFKMRRKDGAVFPTEHSVMPLKDEQGNRIGWVSVVRDITERKKMEEELSKVEKLESIGVLAGGIAHDFNNILAAILGNISLTKLDVERDERTYKLLAEAEMACSRARDLTQQLLTFSRGGAPIKKVASIGELIKEASLFALHGSKARCDLSIPDDLWFTEIDVGQISQVVHNLIINSDQAMPEGGIIDISAENVLLERSHGLPLQPGKYLQISIQDQGTGISKEHLPKIFDPYFTTKQKGSGLGLATVFSIIKRHEGHITVDSQLGVGTTFHLYLPAFEKGLLKKLEDKKRPIVGKGKVLVMDDEEMVRRLAKRMLSRMGFDSEVAKDGAEAIGLYKKAKQSGESFDAVILDLTVPGGMGGKEAVQKMLEIDPEVNAVVSSGYSNDPIMSDFKDHGFRGVVAKPYNMDELSQVLDGVINGGV